MERDKNIPRLFRDVLHLHHYIPFRFIQNISTQTQICLATAYSQQTKENQEGGESFNLKICNICLIIHTENNGFSPLTEQHP